MVVALVSFFEGFVGFEVAVSDNMLLSQVVFFYYYFCCVFFMFPLVVAESLGWCTKRLGGTVCFRVPFAWYFLSFCEGTG